MSCYLTSTQKRFWILSSEDIEKRRSDARRRAIESAQEARASTGEPLQTDASEPLTDEEETLLRRYYEAKILKVCAAFSLPSKVQATAVTLFKRFLLGTSLLQHSHYPHDVTVGQCRVGFDIDRRIGPRAQHFACLFAKGKNCHPSTVFLLLRSTSKTKV